MGRFQTLNKIPAQTRLISDKTYPHINLYWWKNLSTVRKRHPVHSAAHKATTGPKVSGNTVYSLDFLDRDNIGHQRSIQVAITSSKPQQHGKSLAFSHASINDICLIDMIKPKVITRSIWDINGSEQTGVYPAKYATGFLSSQTKKKAAI